MWQFLLSLPLVHAAYCSAGNTVSGDANLGRVSLLGEGGQTIADESNCPGAVGLQDRTYMTAALLPGRNFTLNFQATTCDAGGARLAYAFIDFNGNEVYDANELVGQQAVDNRVTPIDISFNFLVPAIGSGSVVGVTRMRVFVVESGFTANPCLTFSYGGVKEYSIDILGNGGYCRGGNSVIGDSNLGRVSLLGEGGQNIVDESNCPGGTGVQDRTYMTAALLPGKSFTLNFQATTCDEGWARLAYAFVDFNGNEVYDANELVGQQQVDNRVAPIDVSFSFTVPCIGNGSVAGLTRMRVLVVESGFTANPCLAFSYGGVKEYSIQVLNSDCKPPAKYCPAGPTVAEGSNLGAVDLLGLLHTSIQDNSNCPGVVGVRDLTTLSASVMRGGTYVLNIDATTCNGNGYPRLVYAFVDFNNNGKYDPDELVGTVPVGNSPSPIDVSIRVTVPCTAAVGATRMRVLLVEGGHTTDPCLVFAYGGVKEYSIVVLEQQDKACLPPSNYCKAGNLEVADSNLGYVEIHGAQTTSIIDHTNCPNSVGLKNLTNLSVALQPGGNYSLYFEATTCGQGWARLAYAYIDFDGNSVFEPSELLGVANVDDRVSPVGVTLDLVVPCIGNGALVGSTRMRVFVVEGDGLSPDPCARFGDGSVKEFSIEILNKPVKMCFAESTSTIAVM